MGSVCLSSEYLSTCSEPAIESYELSRLNRASNLRKELRQVIDEWIECEVEARLARWTLESRRTSIRGEDASEAGLQAALPQQLVLPLLSLNASAQPGERNEDARRPAPQMKLSPEVALSAASEKLPMPGGTRTAVCAPRTSESANFWVRSRAPRRVVLPHDERIALRLLIAAQNGSRARPRRCWPGARLASAAPAEIRLEHGAAPRELRRRVPYGLSAAKSVAGQTLFCVPIGGPPMQMTPCDHPRRSETQRWARLAEIAAAD